MASSSSSPNVPSSERTSNFSSQTEFEMESSKARHWSQLDYSTTDSEWSPDANYKYFDLLKKDPVWGRFFTEFMTLNVGEKIGGGAQADIFEARLTPDGPFDLVVKVMKGDAPLQSFQSQWPIGMLSARSKYKHLFDLPLITILGGTVLEDKRLRGRFAFVMYRRWGDLRLLIDRRMQRMQQEGTTDGPFPMDQAIHLMLSIAEDMDILHNKHDILHRDLKASNVLVWGEFGEDGSVLAAPNRDKKIGTLVADFECSVGVLGTGFWRAPEILRQSQERVPGPDMKFTRESDVYSYGMLCYEIVTGCIPFDGFECEDMIFQILNGRRPELPLELPAVVKRIIEGCWHSDPLERPNFSDICWGLKHNQCPNPASVVIDNETQSGATIVKVEQWKNPTALTLLQVMQKLIDMDLMVLKASDSSSTEMIIQNFEVTDCKRRKVRNDKFIADIRKVLSLSSKMKWSSESLGRPVDANTVVQMHVIELIAYQIAGILEVYSTFLAEMNYRVHTAGCWTRKDRVECVIYVEGAKTDRLLWELGQSMKAVSAAVDKVAAEDFTHLERRLHNLSRLSFLGAPQRSTDIEIHQWKLKTSFTTLHSATVICLDRPELLLNVSCMLVDLNYRIQSASIDYPGPYVFLRGRTRHREVFDMETLGDDEKGSIKKIVEEAIARRCPKPVSMRLTAGSRAATFQRSEFFDNLIRILRENSLFVTSGHIIRGGVTFFVSDVRGHSENPGGGAV